MADPTMRDVLDQLATVQATVRQQGAELARYRQRRHPGRTARRFLPLMLAGLLVALLPLSILAANPTFSDLGTAAPEHQPNIQAIGNAGITTGFSDPNNPNARLYDPKAPVTREEMASFLARTAGLGANAPVANAKTLQGYAPNGLVRVGTASPLEVYLIQGQEATAGSVTITTPGPGYVLVMASIRFAQVDTGRVTTRVAETTAPPSPGAPPYLAQTVTAANEEVALSPTGTFVVQDAANHTYALLVSGQPTNVNLARATDGHLSALFIPFGPDGAVYAPPTPMQGLLPAVAP